MFPQIALLTAVSEENAALREQLNQAAESTGKVLALESALQEAEAKISELLRVKERFAELSEESLNQTLNLNELGSEFEALSLQSRVTTCMAVVPLLVLCLAVVVAYLPIFSSVFGTADNL
jgi:hypothetical protein